MTFDEAENLLLEQNLDDEVASLVAYEMSVLKDTYAPTVRMTQEQYEVWNIALERSKRHEGDFIYFIDVLDDESSYKDDVFREKLKYFINNSKPLMQAWLHPETIKIVDE